MSETIRSRLVNAALALGALLLSSVAYEQVIADAFTFGGFSVSESALSLPVVAAAVTCAALMLPTSVRHPGELFVWLQFAVTVIPAGVLVSLAGADVRAFWYPLLGTLLVHLVRLGLSSREPARSASGPPDPMIARASWTAVLLVLAALVVAVRGSWNLDLSEVYFSREETRESLSLGMQYLVPIAGTALLPFLAAVALRERRYRQVGLSILLGLGFFAFSSHKAMAVYPVAVIAGWNVTKGTNGHRWTLWAVIGIALLALGLKEQEGIAVWLTGLSLHRILFLPAQITGFYIDYFSTHPHLHWAESKITLGLLKTGLDGDAARVIGEEFFGRSETVANGGWISTGYMNGGGAGLVAYAVLIGGLYAFIDRLALRRGRQFVGALFLVPAATIILTADPLTAVLTHGLGVVVVLCVLYSRETPVPSST